MADQAPASDTMQSSAPPTTQSDGGNGTIAELDGDEHDQPKQDQSSRKRKGEFQEKRLQHGSRKGGRHDDRRRPKGDLGRAEYFRDNTDKRQKTSDAREKRERDGRGSMYGKEFSKEEIDGEERRPKRKVAVFVGYSGTGYKGMQITPSERTIEGDLFKAFIDAGAISKANADDPRKASLVRCARTDKGVHAAGNMISLKLIVEDEDIVQKINSHLPPQIRVWGIERTTGAFSCYQACDSRWYEYLIPSYAFLPPHPSSWLARKLEEYAEEMGDMEQYEARQADVRSFWSGVEDEAIKNILESIDEDIRFDVVKALQGEDEAYMKTSMADSAVELKDANTEEVSSGTPAKTDEASAQAEDAVGREHAAEDIVSGETSWRSEATNRVIRIRAATKQLRTAYIDARRRYRISATRLDRIQKALTKYVGTMNFHNFTIQKSFKDASAKRHIKSFVVNPRPILIGDGPEEEKSQWLSLKVHGQSFMMHQIRKMVGMMTLLVRCGSSLSTLDDSMKEDKFSIPKVPGLGLLLERPVFDSYNANNATKFGREPLLFSKYEAAIEDFKQRDIYQKIFREEEEKNEFHKFFNHIDNFREPYFLYVTSKGLEATKGASNTAAPEMGESDDEAVKAVGEEDSE